MAISGGDGSIILTTKVDETGLNSWIAKVTNQTKGLTNETSRYGKQAKTSFGGVNSSINTVGTSLKKIGSLLATTFGITAIINFSKQAGEFATQTEASVQRLIDIYGEASQSVGDFIDANARAIGMSKASASSFASVYGNLFSVWADQNTNAELTNRYLNMTAVVASKTGRTVQDVQERIRSGLLGNTEAIEDLGVFVNVKTIEMTDAFQRMANGKSWEQLDAYTQQQVRTMAILEQATAKYGNTVADTTATTRAQYQAAYEDFQNTWGQVVNTVLIPVLKILTQVFTIATKGLQVMAGLTGKTIDTNKLLSNQEKSIGGAVDNQEALTDAVKGTNKELKKSLAGYDEINILSQDTAESGGASATGISGGVGGIGNLGGTLDGSSYVEEVNTTLMAIMGIVAEAMIAVGLILLFTGHIGWGVGFIIAGAGLLAVTMASASSFGYDGIINMLTTIMGIAGGALLALGIILLWIGGVVGKGVAIGMIIAGGALIVSAVAAKAAFSPEDVGGWLSLIMGVASGALLALGIILCMVGSVPLGVGMIIAGAIGLVSAVAVNFDSVKNSITGWVAVIMAIAGAALLVLGIVLCATGGALPLGIALIMAGAVALVTPIALNWNAIKEKVVSVFNVVIDWIKTYGLLVLGIILCLTGAGIPLGIALIIKWAKDGAENGVPLATAIVDKVKEIWAAVQQFWNTHIAPIFTAKWWADLGKKCINGLISGFEGGLNGIISGFEWLINKIVEGLNKISITLPDWGILGDLAGKKFGFNINKVSFDRVKIPRLAKGAVIPPNREFLAVLGDQKQGTNIETPESLLREIYAEGNAETNVLLQQLIQVMQKGMTVNVDGKQLMRINREAETRVGRQTVTGGFANAY